MKRDKNSKAALTRRLIAWDLHDREMRREIRRAREEADTLEITVQNQGIEIEKLKVLRRNLQRELNKRTRVLVDLVAHNIGKPQ